MKQLKKLACALICGSMISVTTLPAHADEIDDGFEDAFEGAILLVVGVLVISAVLGKSISSLDSEGDTDDAAKILDEYQRGMGIRLNDPDSAFRVSTLAATSQSWTALNDTPDLGARTFNLADDNMTVEVLRLSYQFD